MNLTLHPTVNCTNGVVGTGMPHRLVPGVWKAAVKLFKNDIFLIKLYLFLHFFPKLSLLLDEKKFIINFLGSVFYNIKKNFIEY